MMACLGRLSELSWPNTLPAITELLLPTEIEMRKTKRIHAIRLVVALR